MSRLVVFDCDGTLVDGQAAICQTMEAAFASTGLVAPERKMVRRMVGLSLPYALRELAPDASVTALDKDARRLMRVHDNLARLGLTAKVIAADASEPTTWWQGQLFDRILLDVPCSATGVIRRHPDIRMLRRREDIAQLVEVQADILERAWQMLKPGGRLLYATCSVLPQENSEQIVRFVDVHPDATLVTLDNDWGIACNAGRQLFPTPRGHDGFYYALLHKTADNNC